MGQLRRLVIMPQYPRHGSDDGDGDEAAGGARVWLAGRGTGGDARRRAWAVGEDEGDGASPCSGASSARSPRVLACHGVYWACMGALGAANAVVARAWAMLGDDHGVLGLLPDMVRGRESSQRERGHGGRHSNGMV
jgi:hypothetical protein